MIQWYHLIILIHSIMLPVNLVFGLIAYRIEKKRKQASKTSYFVQCLSVFINLLFGILLCVSDQLITTNINPLLVACIGIGVLFLLPPPAAVVFYSITFVLFYNMVAWTQHVPELLEHIRINSVTATGMGLGVSWVLWKNHILRLQQKRLIEEQQKIFEEKNEHLRYYGHPRSVDRTA